MSVKSTKLPLQLLCNTKYLQMKGTLNGGQSFRWRQDELGRWIGVFQSKLWILEQNDHGIAFEVHEKECLTSDTKKIKISPDADEKRLQTILSNYFQFDVDLEKHYINWCDADPFFKSVSGDFYGIRVLKQEVIENIFSFICSTNNHIARIQSMIEKLARFYGDFICKHDGKEVFAFPNPERFLEPGVEDKLRANGFGYRAVYIVKTAQMICAENSTKWVDSLQSKSYREAKALLMTLSGVGAKVADCVCLMSLNHLGAIPVDTHVYKIAATQYLPSLPKRKTISIKHYNEIGEKFRQLFGPLAGWAQTVLFCADLKKFQED